MSEPEFDPRVLEIAFRHAHGAKPAPNSPMNCADCRQMARAIMAYAAEREAKLRAERDAAIKAREDAEAELKLVRGAMAAQDEREERAGLACGIPREEHGCDWPDAVAERVTFLRERAKKAEAALDKLREERDGWRDQCIKAERDLAIVRGLGQKEAIIPGLLRERDVAIKALEEAEAKLDCGDGECDVPQCRKCIADQLDTERQVTDIHKKRAEKAEAALRAVAKDREYQKLHGGPHFTSAPTEMEWKAESAREAWALVDEVLASLSEPKEPTR